MLVAKFILLVPLLMLVEAQQQGPFRGGPIRGQQISRWPGSSTSTEPNRRSSNYSPFYSPSTQPTVSASTPAPSSNKIRLYDYNCRYGNSYEAITDKCNYYVECKNNIAYESKCPEGFNFDSTIEYSHYPCNYASQVTCRSRENIPGPRPEEPELDKTNNRIQLRDYSCKRNSQYEAVPNKCDVFIECVNNIAYQYTCPDGLYYDAKIQYPNFPCTYISQVDCPSQSIRETLYDYQCKRGTGYEAVPNKCYFYIECNNTLAYRYTCPEGLSFDDKILYPNFPCNYNTLVECKRPVIETSSTSTTTIAPVPSYSKIRLYDHNCRRGNGYEPIINKCNYFIECSNNIAYQAVCPDGWYFDANIPFPSDPCNYASNVVCTETTPSAITSWKPTQPAIVQSTPLDYFGKTRLYDYQCKRGTGYEAVPNKCYFYIECHNTLAYRYTCPEGLSFDDKILYPNFPCNYNTLVECKRPVIETSSTSTTTIAPVPSYSKIRLYDHNCRRGNGYEPIINKCNYFIECSNNIAYQAVCPDGRYFDANIPFPSDPCNYASNVVCTDFTPAVPPSNKIRLYDYNCKRGNGYEVVPNKCSLYVECINYSAYEVKCPVNQYFDSSVQYPGNPCSYSSRNCHDQSVIDPGKGSATCTQRNMYVNIEGKCDLYTECRDHRAIDMQCPDGLHFNPNTMWPNYPCDYPHNVDCTGRGAPQPAVPTSECPHQYAYIRSPLATPDDCGYYRVCVGGKAIEMYCPPGLAFNMDKAVCDWPSEVATCNVDAYTGYICPPASFTEGVPVTTNHKYEGDCYAFYACLNGKARLLSCDPGFAFNPASARCEDASLVACDSRRAA